MAGNSVILKTFNKWQLSDIIGTKVEGTDVREVWTLTCCPQRLQPGPLLHYNMWYHSFLHLSLQFHFKLGLSYQLVNFLRSQFLPVWVTELIRLNDFKVNFFWVLNCPTPVQKSQLSCSDSLYTVFSYLWCDNTLLTRYTLFSVSVQASTIKTCLDQLCTVSPVDGCETMSVNYKVDF